ncbi:MAG: hypothetical protein HLUCCX10_14440, partial [Algoriphagus marincola HL-49]
MKFKYSFLLLLTFFLAINSCKEVEDPDIQPVIEDPVDDPDTGGVSGFPTIPITVKIPEGMNAGLEGALLYSGIISHPVQANGNSKATVK